MDVIGFIFGISGLSFGILGFTFGIAATNDAKSALSKIGELEQRLGEAGVLES